MQIHEATFDNVLKTKTIQYALLKYRFYKLSSTLKCTILYFVQ